MVHSPIRRAILFVVLCCGGAAAALWLSGFWARIPVEDHRFHGFRSAPAALPRSAHWTDANATIDLPDSGWRPLAISLVLQATEPRVPVTLALNGVASDRAVIGQEPQLVNIRVIDRAGPAAPLALRISPDAPATGVAVLSAAVRPEATRAALWAVAVAGGLAGAFAGILVGVRRSPGTLALAAGLAVACAAAAAAAFGPAALALGITEATTAWAAEAGRVLLLMFLVLFPGWFALDAAADRLDPLLQRNIPLLMFPASALILCVIALALEVAHAPNGAFFIAVWLTYALPAAVVVSDRDRRMRFLRLVRDHRALLLLPALVALCAILYASAGVPSLDVVDDWPRIANRNVMAMPGDNVLSWLASQTWRLHLPANALYFYPWRIGDRGPLYALLHVFLSRGIELQSPTFANYTRLGIVLNAMSLAPMFVWLESQLGRRAAWWCTALVGLNPWFFLSIYFTWPKMFGASFALTAIWLLWRRPAPESPYVYAAAGVLFGLSSLAHVGGALSLPMFLAVTLVVFTRSRRSRLALLLVPVSFLVVMLPWQLYKQWYSPESFSLFYLHYLDAKGYFTPFRENVARFFSEHPPQEQIAVRLDHLRELWWGTLARKPIVGFWTGRDIGAGLYLDEFYSPWYTAGIVGFAGIIVALPVAVILRATHASGRIASWFARAPRPAGALPIWPVATFVAASLTVNEALRWARPFSHELPYCELLLLAALLLITLARLGWAWLAFPAIVVVVRQAFYARQSALASVDDLPALDMSGRLFWITLAAVLLIVCSRFLATAEPEPAGRP